MRKLFLSIIALTLGIGAWAQETQSVDYIDADGQQQTVTATVVTDETETLINGWYVVTGEVSRGSITCDGDVHLILADGAKLTAMGDNTSRTPGVQVSGEGDSLTIYGQSAQSGQLIANGGMYAAGIGGGYHSSGSNITINGGTVTASGGEYGAGIGGGYDASGSNIRIAFELTVYADNQNPPTTEIPHATGYDIAQYLNGRRYVMVKDVITGLKSDAIAAINAAISDTDNDNVKAIAANAETAINAATTVAEIAVLKEQVLAAIASARAAYTDGKAEAFGPLGTEHPGPAVKVTKGDKEVILYLPDKVEYIIRK